MIAVALPAESCMSGSFHWTFEFSHELEKQKNKNKKVTNRKMIQDSKVICPEM